MASAAVASAAAPRPRARLGKKEKLQLRQDTATEALPAPLSNAKSAGSLDWFPLQQKQASTCPVIFSKDSLYAFVSSGSAVKIYSVLTAELLSTLSPSAFAPAPSSAVSRKVSSLLLNPSNPLQLIVGSLDGTLRIWDFHEGKLLRTLDLGAPVLHAAGHSSLSDQLFVALQAPAEASATGKKGSSKVANKTSPSDSTPLAGIYSVSLRPSSSTTPPSPSTPRPPSRRMRLAHPRPVRALSVSPDGAFLLSLNPHSINLCRTAHLGRGFAVTLDSDEALTTLAFHPSENYFATGNERGQIKFWYGVLEAEGQEQDTALIGAGAARPSTALFHWHAHAVASLCFTPNGAYLLSGGEEAVMVLWQLHTGHQEFVPRLGAPIVTLSITEQGEKEQQVAARLRDGTVQFIGAQKLKISRTISGLKADPPRAALPSTRSSANHRIPLALLPSTSTTLVLPSSHPSSLQFYSPSLDAQLLELEVSPSNRVSAAGEKPLEPTRVELVAFCQPEGKRDGGYWMATVDSWRNGNFAPQQRLKFWQHKAGTAGAEFTLNSRIDSPHSSPITSLTFSPASPLLLTTSLDGRIKMWSYTSTTGSWTCRSSLTYRSFLPLSAAWSKDGSMFAVAHSRSVTLWSTAGLSLIHAFPCESVAPVGKVEFVGEEGSGLMAGGEHGTVGWDLLTFEETFNLTFEVASLTGKPHSSTIIATEKGNASTSTAAASSASAEASTSTAFIIHAPSTSSTSSSTPACSTRQLPFPVHQSLWLESPLSTPAAEEELSLAVVSSTGEISLLGAAARVGADVLPTRLPSLGGSKGQSRLFDEIFGTEQDATKLRSAPAVEASKGKGKAAVGEGLELLETPAHALPPVRMLWRSMLGGFKVSQKVAGGEEEKMVLGEGEEESEGKTEKVKVASLTQFAPTESDELAKIFKARLVLASPTKSPHKKLHGTPKGGKGGKK